MFALLVTLRHISTLFFIIIDMRFFSCIGNIFYDLKCRLCACKWRAIFCGIICLLGIVLGAVLFNISQYNWWYSNRCSFAEQLVNGGFGVLLSFAISSAILFLLLTLCSMSFGTHFLVYFVLATFSFYCGANSAAIIICYGVFGIIYVLLVATIEIIGLFVVCFLCICEKSCRRTFCEAFRDLKPCLFVILITLLAKIISFFVILRLITAFI